MSSISRKTAISFSYKASKNVTEHPVQTDMGHDKRTYHVYVALPVVPHIPVSILLATFNMVHGCSGVKPTIVN